MMFHEYEGTCAEILRESWPLGANGKILRREDSVPSMKEEIVFVVDISCSWVNTRESFSRCLDYSTNELNVSKRFSFTLV